MNDCMISIIVPIYNTERYLGSCIESLINQSYNDLEIILINDGSTDSSDKICQTYVKQDDRIKYKYIKNSGVSVARNHGLGLATGEYILFVDSDDYIDSDMCRRMMERMKKGKFDLVSCGHSNVYGNKNIPEHLKNEDITINEIDYELIIYLSKVILGRICGNLYKKRFINYQFEDDLSIGEDKIFNIEYIKKIESISITSETLYYYRRNVVDSLTNSNWEKQIKNLSLFKEKEFEIYSSLIGNVLADKLSQHNFILSIFFVTLKVIRGNYSYRYKRNIFRYIHKTYGFNLIKVHEFDTSKKNKLLLLLVQKKLFGLLFVYFFLKDNYGRKIWN